MAQGQETTVAYKFPQKGRDLDNLFAALLAWQGGEYLGTMGTLWATALGSDGTIEIGGGEVVLRRRGSGGLYVEDTDGELGSVHAANIYAGNHSLAQKANKSDVVSAKETQTFTDAQKAQARTNIGAAKQSIEITPYIVQGTVLPEAEIYTYNNTPITPIQISESYDLGSNVYLYFLYIQKNSSFEITQEVKFFVFKRTTNGYIYQETTENLPSWVIAQILSKLHLVENVNVYNYIGANKTLPVIGAYSYYYNERETEYPDLNRNINVLRFAFPIDDEDGHIKEQSDDYGYFYVWYDDLFRKIHIWHSNGEYYGTYTEQDDRGSGDYRNSQNQRLPYVVLMALNIGNVSAMGSNNFSEEQKEQVRVNIGTDNAPTYNSQNLVKSGGVKASIDYAYNNSVGVRAQTFNETQKAQARANIGIAQASEADVRAIVTNYLQ